MGEPESVQQSKKRAAVKELSRDDPGLDDEEDSSELESGTFKRASDEVLASRRIVRVKRKEASATTSSSNPFAGIRLVHPTGTVEETNSSLAESKLTSAETVTEGEKPAPDDQRTDATKETTDVIKENNSEAISTGKDAEDESSKANNQETAESKAEDAVGKETEKAKEEADNRNTVKETDQTGDRTEKGSAGDQTENEGKENNESENVEKNGDGGALSSFQQHSSTKNAFTGLAGTGFSSSSFSFSSVSQEGSTGSGSLFGQKADQTSFSFGLSNNGNSSLFGGSGTSIITKSEGSAFPSKEEVSVETGEENERVEFSADSVLFEFFDGAWKERGKGEIKVNVSTNGTGKARLLMRARGNYRLILNAGLFPEMKLTNMDKKGITFACVNSIGEGKDGLSTFALKFKDPTFVEVFRAAVMKHKDGKQVEAAPLKTPENSP
ncbi:PREDICTED: nuclear pore complex protein NUP50A-like [Tarenaya hassleriana]|uniref:nuclear pore complex protein NUP50A-like n=1 Tax=Tarenaya hassleriana TaxID=28532 RepID=UPI00053C0F96|nr:PREDICTED: nuclear pore complex protein NUP50A-like [Tarenaya hassleriana]XP_010535154.1 PREDICTED: nuclear pore complex protein NUP50A-like [Tarenaya hassleriana]XP_010535156.1 PREDICTED: nuclear pore complex protein NUP50A-like [Tarenaya hassleriana]XP_010535157.1 PREDICTED: nuclear pore complex protein NUP50A-like [Tarenaya hassleriana]XP_010535158.1 PREDICTED: nuclear pore complex protein NUP50A-like [Tarenaya hassleriana]